MNLVLRHSIDGRSDQFLPLDQPTLTIGRLTSNQIILASADPIHGILELLENGMWRISDLGSEAGVYLNGSKIDIEAIVQPGDKFKIGQHTLTIEQKAIEVPPFPDLKLNLNLQVPDASNNDPSSGELNFRLSKPLPHANVAGFQQDEKTSSLPKKIEVPVVEKDVGTKTHFNKDLKESNNKNRLFVNKEARAGGDVLEVVAYWGDTVLEIEHFNGESGEKRATIGSPPNDNFIAAGEENLSGYTLAKVTKDNYKIYLLSSMRARLRRAGKIEKVSEGKFSLGQRDIAQVKYGPVSYFMLFVRPPALEELKRKALDPLSFSLILVSALIFLSLIPVIIFGTPSKTNDEKDDVWAIVNLPEKPQPEVKKIEPPKPKVDIKKEEKPPEQPKPPKPLPPPPKPVEAKVAEEKPQQTKPAAKPIEEKKNIAQEMVKNPAPVSKPTTLPAQTVKAEDGLAKTNKAPDNKAAGQVQPNKAVGPSGGNVGGGNPTAGAPRKGTDAASTKGVEGVNNKKASGVNLSSLGLGAGKILNKSAPGAIMTNFKDSAGGMGGGSGSASKTLGMGGGIGTGSSLGLGGTSGAANNFGSGTGGLLSGQGGSGGKGMGAFGSGAGRGQIKVNISEGGAPGVDGGLTQQEVSQVIRAHLNEIRHCYETLLQSSPSAAGKVEVKFVVAGSGIVTSASVLNSGISDARMQGCIVSKIKTWKFPQPRGGQAVNVAYPFVFNPI